MGTEIDGLEERMKSFLEQLQAESEVFERVVYKNKNQHKRCSYFQYILKVRRDLRHLQSVKLEDILSSCFQVINGRKPKKKVHLLESLKWRKSDCGTPNFMERLLGAARLLSQMVEPMLKAATELSILLARSFFMGFSLTMLALLARLRVLIQQILLDVVSVFNMVSSISRKKQSVKIIEGGIEVFREYYPTNKVYISLECVWTTDKFGLLETTQKCNLKGQDEVPGDASVGKAVPRYRSIESFLEEDSDTEQMNENHTAKEGPAHTKEDSKGLFTGTSPETEHRKEAVADIQVQVYPETAGNPDEDISSEGDMLAMPSPSPSTKPLSSKSATRQVAFVSIKRPATTDAAFVSVKRPAKSTDKKDEFGEAKDGRGKVDSFFNLLTGGSFKDSLL